MPNNYFQFKQFTIQQEHCAMKVCTDACLFGAIAASAISDQKQEISNILDIGTGTGLLSLMLAQQVNAHIDAIEIDELAYHQAQENFATSPWKERLTAIRGDILQFDTGKKYDCIISNPPFFEDDLPSPHQNRNKAMHDASLTLEQLLKTVDKTINKEGVFLILLPYHRTNYFIEKASHHDFYLAEKTQVRQTPKHNFFRSILSFSKKEKEKIIIDITIKDNDQKYSPEFTKLLKEYYLHM